MSSDVKWIKLLTSLPDDEKIKIIESMPDRDAIFYIWIRLLIQAGKCNAGGYIYLAPDIPFTDEQLSTIFNRPLNTIRLAISTFESLHMIEIYENGHIFIPRFPEIQNVEGMEKIKEQARLRQAKFRDNKQLPEGKPSNATSRDSNVIDKIRVDKKRIDKSYSQYGEFNNVLLTDEEYIKLKERFGLKVTKELIANLSAGIESKGYKYRSHYAAILNWHRRDQVKSKDNGKKPLPDNFDNSKYERMIRH